MDAMAATAEMTASEFLALGLRNGASRRELVDGELVVSEASRKHNGAQGCIYGLLWQWAHADPHRGWAGLPLDVVWYRTGRVPERGDPPPYAVPDLVVEVRSPSTWRYDIGAKKANYERYGAAELWLVDTAADVALVFRRSKPDAQDFDVSLELTAADTLTSPLLPGFSLPVGEIFEG